MSAFAFRLKAELATIEFSVEKRLYSESAGRQNVHQLENWKAKLPSSLQPDRIVWSTMPTVKEPIILLHFAYYRALSEIHDFAAHLNQEDDISVIRQIQSSKMIQASAASQIINILQYLPCEPPGHLWHILCYPISACITLLAVVLENPTDAQAHSYARYIGHLVRFLTRVQQNKVLEAQSLLDLCSEFERLALHAISKAAANGTVTSTSPSISAASGVQNYGQKILSYTTSRTSSLQLAQGLMGNVPHLCAIAARTFSGLIPTLQLSPSTGLLSPSSLNPETYGSTVM